MRAGTEATAQTEKGENAVCGLEQGANENWGFPGGSDGKESACN